MIDILLNKEKELKVILNDFFRKKYQRNSIPEFSIDYDTEAFQVACQIYKRGFINIANVMSEVYQDVPIQFLDNLQFEQILQKKNAKQIFYIVDMNICKYYEKFIPSEKIFLYKASELNKNIDSVITILKSLPKECNEIIAIGGGNTLDVSGFVAAIAKIPIIYCATTLLATVDAATGGKTGVNCPLYGKNQIGLFYKAKEFYCVPEFFHTLPHSEIISGLCEALKHSWLYGSFAEEKKYFEEILISNCSIENLKIFLIKNIEYKTNIITQDPFERKGIRLALNFGHTLAHLIEALAEDKKIERMPHGISVAHGIYFLIKNRIIECPCISFLNYLEKIIILFPIVKISTIDSSNIERYIRQDKKNINTFQCALSLPSYGQFSMSKNNVAFIDLLKNYTIDYLVVLTSQYLNSFNIHS
ncbi:3-dehydroquinate synthase family protein [Fluviispira sanaruensis]|uniref:Uncharacterized protein n=1 Tax=Fluviispira sanaruensis TaxID=2493639 RepID=A0A4P2VJ36_FLUSA|nr:hypothetical protein [Fluviispira sanaruensis]BBH53136.1 hypothetical protein JCM31447_15790 [Fluviispira sanaruensis]